MTCFHDQDYLRSLSNVFSWLDNFRSLSNNKEKKTPEGDTEFQQQRQAALNEALQVKGTSKGSKTFGGGKFVSLPCLCLFSHKKVKLLKLCFHEAAFRIWRFFCLFVRNEAVKDYDEYFKGEC